VGEKAKSESGPSWEPGLFCFTTFERFNRRSQENISNEMGVTIGKIIINAVKMFSYNIKPASYESKALEMFKLLNLNCRKNT
jgi:hypothetical protein